MSLAFISIILFGNSDKESIEKTREVLAQYVQEHENHSEAVQEDVTRDVA